MKVSDIKGLDWIIARMGKLTVDWPMAEYHQLVKAWRKAKIKIDESGTEPGESVALMNEIIATPEFRNYRNCSKAIFESSEAGKAKRRKWNARAYAKRKNTTEYREYKRAYDKRRYAAMKNMKATE